MPLPVKQAYERHYINRETRRGHAKAHVSELVFCIRKAWYNRFYGQTFTPSRYCTMGRGEAIEHWNLMYYPQDWKQVRVENDWIIGTMDGKIDNLRWQFGLEMKTTVWGKDYNHFPIQDYYMRQIMLYHYLSGLLMVLWVHNFVFKTKEDGESKSLTDEMQFVVIGDKADEKKYSREWYRSLTRIAKKYITYYVAEQKLPPKDPQETWECDYCDYKEMCDKEIWLELLTGEIPKLELNNNESDVPF